MSAHLRAQIQKAAILGLFGGLRDNFFISDYYRELESIARVHNVQEGERGHLAQWWLQFDASGDSLVFSWIIYFKDETLGAWLYECNQSGSRLRCRFGSSLFSDDLVFPAFSDELFMRIFAELQKAFLHYIRRHRLSAAASYTVLLKPSE